MVNEMGHLLPSFQIGKILKDCGYRVMYGIQLDKVPLIESMGFDYKIMPVFLFSAAHSVNDTIGEAFDKIIEKFFNRITNHEVRFTEEQVNLFANAIQSVNPVLMLLDSFLTSNYLLLRTKPPTILLQTMMLTYRDVRVPPLCSSLVPRNSFAKIATWYEWEKYFLKSRFTRAVYFGDTLNGITKRLAKRQGIHLEGMVIWDKAFHVGLKNIWEIVLAPQSFDFLRRSLKPNQIYVGLCTDHARNDIDVDPEYEEYMNSLQKDASIIYCSLGTLAQIHFNGVSEFYKKVINAFRFRSEILILSVGSFDRFRIQNIPSNVRLFTRVPQIALLKRCRIMITHGGLNSVLESIMCGKPILVFPLNNAWDQNGNAARVIYHGVGLRGNIRRTSSKRINKQITELLNDNYYKRNVEKLKESFSEDKVSHVTIEKIISIAKNINNENK